MELKRPYSRRYQECGWLERVWRRRHMLPIPFTALRVYWYNKNLGLRSAYSLARGLADIEMNWLYTWEEVKRDAW